VVTALILIGSASPLDLAVSQMDSNHHSVTPARIDPLELSVIVTGHYHNVSLGAVNDHEVRLSVMTEQFGWHRHPDSDETFVGVEGELVIEFEHGEVRLGAGQLATVPAGTLHRTRPAGKRSVNLTFERSNAATVFNSR
jgi:homogentisate 1,2-dioxygenase